MRQEEVPVGQSQDRSRAECVHSGCAFRCAFRLEKLGCTRSLVYADSIRWAMNFRSMNDFNVLMNSLSGNFFPVTEDKRRPDIGNTIYAIFTWVFNLMYLFSTMIGLIFYVPAMEAVQKGGTTAIVCFEMLSLSAYLNSQREHLRNLIRRVNSILIESNELERCIRDSVAPHKQHLKLYTVAAVGSIIVWAGMPIVKVLDNDRFTYNDYSLPSYVPGAPFSPRIFVLSVIMQTVGSSYIILKKIGIDVYMSYFITLLTAEYRYVQKRMTAAFGEKDERLVIDALKECVQHHCKTMETGEMLVDILSVNIGLTYLNCIGRFCFVAFSVITLPGVYVAKFLTLMFAMGSLMQVYMLCSCIQELLETSTSVVDGAFHEDWYGRGPIVRNIFRTVGLGSRIECRLTAFRIVDLTVPTFATILNKAYSACLFLLTV